MILAGVLMHNVKASNTMVKIFYDKKNLIINIHFVSYNLCSVFQADVTLPPLFL